MLYSTPTVWRRKPRTQERYLGALEELQRRAAQNSPPDHPRWIANCIDKLTKRAAKKEKRREHKQSEKNRRARESERAMASDRLRARQEVEQ